MKHYLEFSLTLLFLQDIASIYYDIKEFKKGEVKTGLMRAEERLRRKQAMKNNGER